MNQRVMLADTSVWMDHLRRANNRLVALLNHGEVRCHPFVIGEVACGHLQNRDEILNLLKALPEVLIAEHSEVLHFVNMDKLYGRGLGWVDLNLLASASITRCSLWTLDKRLQSVAAELKVSV